MSKNALMENNFCVLHKKSMLDVRIYEWIACAKHHIPSLSVLECSKSFIAFHGISEKELTLDGIAKTYNRIQKEIFEELKTSNQINSKKI